MTEFHVQFQVFFESPGLMMLKKSFTLPFPPYPGLALQVGTQLFDGQPVNLTLKVEEVSYSPVHECFEVSYFVPRKLTETESENFKAKCLKAGFIDANNGVPEPTGPRLVK